MGYPADSTFSTGGPPGGAGRGLRARIAGPGREFPEGDAPRCPSCTSSPTTGGATRAPGGRASWSSRAHRRPRDLTEVRARGRPGRGDRPQRGRGRRDRSALAEPFLRLPGRLRTSHAVAGLPAQAAGDARPGWTLAEDPAEEVERFFSRMVSPSAWRRLSDEGRAGRRADGPALVADLLDLRGALPSRSRTSPVPALFGGAAPPASRTTATAWPGWAPTCPARRSTDRGGTTRGAPSHPDHFAALPRRGRAGEEA